MRKIGIFSVICATMLWSCGSDSRLAKTSIETELDSVSYSLGLGYGISIKKSNSSLQTLDLDALALGMKDALEKDSNYLVKAENLNQIINTYFERLSIEAENAYFEESKKIEGIQSTASGILYKVLEEGEGNNPNLTDTVECHYEGKLIDGKIFDSSYKYGKPIAFPLNSQGMIKGWTEIIQLMNKGSKWRVIIPSNLAYGLRGNREIPPNAPLDFIIELTDIR